ncbi:hypothetical protein [Deinococcus roseus]|uniref:Uncharacterized protein n=1 Tax=Deinococcus roseus TaxID=392414 RepID=A0ABQ2D3D5_9DEIO|nr:hypothetical protein [Deinococcus roseus]GGJ44308.1 hypothetical protein GCM10008938_33170 [Deinococcus roseus]
MKFYTLYSGINVDTENLPELLTQLQAEFEPGKVTFPDHRPHWQTLLQNPGLLKELEADSSRVPFRYACGDFAGASRYAVRDPNVRKGKKAALVVELHVLPEQLVVDFRDGLGFVLQQTPVSLAPDIRKKREDFLLACYGPRLLELYQNTGHIKDTEERDGLLNAFTFCPDVIEHHYRNGYVFAGRYDTLFRSAFRVLLDLPAIPYNIILLGNDHRQHPEHLVADFHLSDLQ